MLYRYFFHILASKLEMNPGAGPEPPITPLTMLRLMFNVSRAAANHLGLKDLFPETTLPDQLLHQLEILACDSLTLQHRPAEVALALLAANFQQRATREPGHATALMGFISELQKYCNVSIIITISSKCLESPKFCKSPKILSFDQYDQKFVCKEMK